MLGKSIDRLSRTMLPPIIAINSATVIIRHPYSISTTSAAEYSSASEMTYIVSSGALNSTHTLLSIVLLQARWPLGAPPS